MNQSYCRSCKQPIFWLLAYNRKTGAQSWMPVNPQEALDEEVFDVAKHVSHYATCPDAKKWRTRRMARPKIPPTK